MDDQPSSYLNKKQIFTVGEISSIISEVLSSELFMDIKVRGEIISKQEKNGNVYLTLIDSDQKSGYSNKPKATLKVIVFSWYDRTITTSYKVGDEVVVGGDMSYYAPFNSLSLNAKNLYLYGEGMELIKLKRLKEKLAKEGIFDSSRKSLSRPVSERSLLLLRLPGRLITILWRLCLKRFRSPLFFSMLWSRGLMLLDHLSGP